MSYDLILALNAKNLYLSTKQRVAFVPTVDVLKEAFERTPNARRCDKDFWVVQVELQEEHHQELIDLDAPPNMPQTYTRVASGKITFIKILNNGVPEWIYTGPVRY